MDGLLFHWVQFEEEMHKRRKYKLWWRSPALTRISLKSICSDQLIFSVRNKWICMPDQYLQASFHQAIAKLWVAPDIHKYEKPFRNYIVIYMYVLIYVNFNPWACSLCHSEISEHAKILRYLFTFWQSFFFFLVLLVLIFSFMFSKKIEVGLDLGLPTSTNFTRNRASTIFQTSCFSKENCREKTK